MVGLMQDLGDLGRLVMSAEGRWTHGQDVAAELGYELAECLWWLLVLAGRYDVDLKSALTGFLAEREARLRPAVEGLGS
jgi:NTP pyrophosphatase (non-canonical NTP hydrolase)